MLVRILHDIYPWTWVTLGVLFCIFEFVPLFTGHPQYTLSDYVWKLEKVHQSWTFLRYTVAAVSLFIFLHLTFGVLR